MVASSFLLGHQEPAANKVSLPGFTRISPVNQMDKQMPRINPRASTRRKSSTIVLFQWKSETLTHIWSWGKKGSWSNPHTREKNRRTRCKYAFTTTSWERSWKPCLVRCFIIAESDLGKRRAMRNVETKSQITHVAIDSMNDILGGQMRYLRINFG